MAVQSSCQLEIPKQPKLADEIVHVGRPLLLKCRGDYDKDFDFSKAQFKLMEHNQIELKVLKSEARSVMDFDVEFVTYKVGENKWPQLTLTDGQKEIVLGDQNFKVISVIKEPEEGQKVEPYGMLYPIPMGWPLAYTILIGLLTALITYWIIQRIRRAAKYAKLVADLSVHRSSVAPDLQFYKSMRLCEKKDYPIEEIERAFKLYVLRKFDVPTLTLPEKELKTFLKEKFKSQKDFRDRLYKALTEFHVLKMKNSQSLELSARRDFARKLMKFVDQAESNKWVLKRSDDFSDEASP